jgi:hypothetical protein
MRFHYLLIALLAVVFINTDVTATPEEDQEAHERWEQEHLHPRGELAAEQIARLKHEPEVNLQVEREAPSAAISDLLRQLHNARTAGAALEIRELEAALASQRGVELSFLDDSQPQATELVVVNSTDIDSEDDRWLPHEFLLAGGEFNETYPSLDSDLAGNLYAAYQVEASPGEYQLAVAKSSDGGEHWEILFSIWGANIVSPSLAIAEGAENWLFLALENEDNGKIYIYRYNLDDPLQQDFTTIIENPAGLSNPRIATDCADYYGWYVYLVFNALAVDNWVFLHSRTIDYGETWSNPEIVGGYCGYPDEFYDATNAFPDIGCGSANVHIAFDNYPSPCTTTTRDVYLLTSHDYGVTWDPAVELTSDVDDEYEPAVGAVNNDTVNPTTVVAYNRYYNEWDDDVWYGYTQDDGASWTLNRCIACATPEERDVNLVTSNGPGSIHAAFWEENNIDYAVADYASPTTWVREDSLSTVDTVTDSGGRPGILIDPTKPVNEEAGIAWVDTRNSASAGLDIFYDAAVLPIAEVDYYVYSTLNPGHGAICGIDGFIDEAGAIEGLPGAEYIFFTGGPLYEGDITAYIYRVETAGDPETHPDNPLNTGPIATRTFIYVDSHFLGTFSSAHNNAFYIDETGIYYGPSDDPRNDVPGWATYMGCAIYRWDFGWLSGECVLDARAPGGNQTLARNPNTGEWWGGLANRNMFMWDGAAWVSQFVAPHLGGGHHDGLEIIGSSLFISDMTSDAIIQYRLDDGGIPIDPPGVPCQTFFYSHAPAVEGMGHGPNNHIWIASGGTTLYEIGGGALQLAVEGIPNQCVLPGGLFDTFDLDDYVAGTPPYDWTWEGNSDISVSVSVSNIVTITYPPGWTGQETVTFTVTDVYDRIASDQATFTVCPAPVVGDIPDQVEPFVPFDLDNYLLDGMAELITWTASGMTCLDVTIDQVTHVATVSNPGGCDDSESITFTAAVAPCAETMSDSDAALFEPTVSAVNNEPAIMFSLGEPVPNPYSTMTRITYSIPPGSGSDVSLFVYDISGHVVKALVRPGETDRSGVVSWDGRNEAGMPATSGVYFLQLSWNGHFQNRRLVLMR